MDWWSYFIFDLPEIGEMMKHLVTACANQGTANYLVL